MNATVPTFLGQPEVVWSALEAIGTILAVSLTLLLILGNRLVRFLWKPHIQTKIRQWRYLKEKMEPGEYGHVRYGYFQFKLDVQNTSWLWLFGDELFDLKILYWLDTKAAGVWTYYGELDLIRYIPQNEHWLADFEITDINRVPDGDYTLILKYITKENGQERELGKQHYPFRIPSRDNILS
jgi:hypothetical protein